MPGSGQPRSKSEKIRDKRRRSLPSPGSNVIPQSKLAKVQSKTVEKSPIVKENSKAAEKSPTNTSADKTTMSDMETNSDKPIQVASGRGAKKIGEMLYVFSVAEDNSRTSPTAEDFSKLKTILNKKISKEIKEKKVVQGTKLQVWWANYKEGSGKILCKNVDAANAICDWMGSVVIGDKTFKSYRPSQLTSGTKVFGRINEKEGAYIPVGELKANLIALNNLENNGLMLNMKVNESKHDGRLVTFFADEDLTTYLIRLADGASGPIANPDKWFVTLHFGLGSIDFTITTAKESDSVGIRPEKPKPPKKTQLNPQPSTSAAKTN